MMRTSALRQLGGLHREPPEEREKPQVTARDQASDEPPAPDAPARI